MITVDQIADFTAAVFGHVFGMKCSTIRHIDSFVPDAEEMPAASIPFTGDYEGWVALYIAREYRGAVVSRLLDRYAIRTPVEDKFVFSEIMNIFSANMATAVRDSGALLSIGAPGQLNGPDTALDVIAFEIVAEDVPLVIAYYIVWD